MSKRSGEWRYCFACGYDQHLTEHHIHPRNYRAVYQGNIDEPANKVILCMGCHRAVHYAGPPGKLKRKLKALLEKPIDKDRLGEQALRDTYTARDEAARLLKTLDQPRARRVIQDYQKRVLEARRLWEAKKGRQTFDDEAA